MADIEKEDWVNKSSDEQTKLEQGDDSVIIFDDIPEYAKSLFTKLNESIDKTNTHTGTIATNTSKTGISTSQASAITANTNKTGITSAQATAITNITKGVVAINEGTIAFSINKGNLSIEHTSAKGTTQKIVLTLS